jgi:predicted RNA methylase
VNAQIDLIEGTTRDLSKSQWFTPPELAQKVVEWANIFRSEGPTPRVLEPSAGNGALVRPLVAAGAHVMACEIDGRYAPELEAMPIDRVWGDFLTFEVSELNTFDLVVTNPPYERTEQCPQGQDVAFILHALKFAPRVVGIFTDRILFGVERKEGLWSKVRPTRIAFQSRRPFKGAQTDYVVLELVMRADTARFGEGYTINAALEWW